MSNYATIIRCIQGVHCLLDVSPKGIERLLKLQIYPVLVILRLAKGAKQVKELCEMLRLTPKVNSKTAKDMLDKAENLEKQLANINCQKTIGQLLTDRYQRCELNYLALIKRDIEEIKIILIVLQMT